MCGVRLDAMHAGPAERRCLLPPPPPLPLQRGHPLMPGLPLASPPRANIIFSAGYTPSRSINNKHPRGLVPPARHGRRRAGRPKSPAGGRRHRAANGQCPGQALKAITPPALQCCLEGQGAARQVCAASSHHSLLGRLSLILLLARRRLLWLLAVVRSRSLQLRLKLLRLIRHAAHSRSDSE